MMWFMLLLSTIELIVMHFLLSLFHKGLALFVSVLTVVSILWLIRFLMSLRKFPVLLSADKLVMRLGNAIEIKIDRDNVVGTRQSWSDEILKKDKIPRLSLLAYPNVVIDLKEPVV